MTTRLATWIWCAVGVALSGWFFDKPIREMVDAVAFCGIALLMHYTLNHPRYRRLIQRPR